MNEQYLYPQNLKSQAKLWLWNLRDLAIIGTALLMSVLAIAQLKMVLPLGLTLGYAFLTIRMEDNTVLDFIKRGFRYFVTSQQYYEWKSLDIGSHTERSEID